MGRTACRQFPQLCGWSLVVGYGTMVGGMLSPWERKAHKMSFGAYNHVSGHRALTSQEMIEDQNQHALRGMSSAAPGEEWGGNHATILCPN